MNHFSLISVSSKNNIEKSFQSCFIFSSEWYLEKWIIYRSKIFIIHVVDYAFLSSEHQFPGKLNKKAVESFSMIFNLLFPFDKSFSFHLSRCKFYFYTNNTAKRILCRTHLFTFIDHYFLDVRFIWPVERL